MDLWNSECVYAITGSSMPIEFRSLGRFVITVDEINNLLDSARVSLGHIV